MGFEKWSKKAKVRRMNGKFLPRPMRTLTIVDLSNKEAKMVLASKLYEMSKLSLGQAAEFCRLL